MSPSDPLSKDQTVVLEPNVRAVTGLNEAVYRKSS